MEQAGHLTVHVGGCGKLVGAAPRLGTKSTFCLTDSTQYPIEALLARSAQLIVALCNDMPRLVARNGDFC